MREHMQHVKIICEIKHVFELRIIPFGKKASSGDFYDFSFVSYIRHETWSPQKKGADFFFNFSHLKRWPFSGEICWTQNL